MNSRKLLVAVWLVCMIFAVGSGSALAEDLAFGIISSAQKIDESMLAADERVGQTDPAVRKENDDEVNSTDNAEEEESTDGIADPIYAVNGAVLQINDTPQDDEEDDPFYPVNVVVFHINDALHDYVLNPVAKVYKYVTPEIFRIGMGNAFSNLKSLSRAANNALQMEAGGFGIELFRFVFNSTVGIAGLFDASHHLLGIDKHEANFSGTLRYYGFNDGPYMVLPIFGPSSPLDTVGLIGDQAAYPLTWIGGAFLDPMQVAGITAFDTVNDKSFNLGNYELLVGNAFDPYVALRDAYLQCRKEKARKARKH